MESAAGIEPTSSAWKAEAHATKPRALDLDVNGASARNRTPGQRITNPPFYQTELPRLG